MLPFEIARNIPMNLSFKIGIGTLIGLMNVAVTSIYLADRPIGASTSYPYAAGQFFGLQSSTYFRQIDVAGSWEFWFLVGTFLGAFVGALLFGHFKLSVVPSLWANLKGPSASRRLVWAFIGGFLLILGARLADGCTSGHILSGGMELAVSSLVFAVFVMISAVVTARYFYGASK